jgi:hypothetical protein
MLTFLGFHFHVLSSVRSCLNNFLSFRLVLYRLCLLFGLSPYLLSPCLFVLSYLSCPLLSVCLPITPFEAPCPFVRCAVAVPFAGQTEFARSRNVRIFLSYRLLSISLSCLCLCLSLLSLYCFKMELLLWKALDPKRPCLSYTLRMPHVHIIIPSLIESNYNNGYVLICQACTALHCASFENRFSPYDLVL